VFTKRLSPRTAALAGIGFESRTYINVVDPGMREGASGLRRGTICQTGNPAEAKIFNGFGLNFSDW
jgi:hypothetical protein